jgi:hypothetical protein
MTICSNSGVLVLSFGPNLVRNGLVRNGSTAGPNAFVFTSFLILFLKAWVKVRKYFPPSWVLVDGTPPGFYWDYLPNMEDRRKFWFERVLSLVSVKY